MGFKGRSRLVLFTIAWSAMVLMSCDMLWDGEEDDPPPIDDTPPTLQEIFDWIDGRHESLSCSLRDDHGDPDFDRYYCSGSFHAVRDHHCVPLVVDAAARTIALEGSELFFSLPTQGDALQHFDSTSTINGAIVMGELCYEEGDLALSLMAGKPETNTLEIAYGTCDTRSGDVEYTAGSGGGIFCIMYAGSNPCESSCN